MAKVKVKFIFHDIEENKLRQAGDIFDCTNVRADLLNNRGLVQVLEKDEEVKPERDKADKPSYKKK